MRKVKSEAEVKKVECLLLCLGRRVWANLSNVKAAGREQPVLAPLTFDKSSKVCKKGTNNDLRQSEGSSLTSQFIFARQSPIHSSCRENA